MAKLSRVILIGASAGGVNAVRKILDGLRLDFDLPIAVVQHLPPKSRLDVYNVYGGKTPLGIVEVEDKMEIQPATIYMATPNYHLLVEADRSFSLSQDEWVNFSRPSIDVFFTSAAQSIKQNAVGILLTGANADGAEGLRHIGQAGGLTIIQDPEEAECDTMPRAGLLKWKPDHVLNLEAIGAFLNSLRNDE